MLHQPRFQWHRRIVHSALDHLLRHLPTPVLPNVPHSASCGLLEGCLTATPSFPTLTVQVGCQQRTVQLGLSVTTQLWLGAGWETVLPAVAARAVEWDIPLPNLAGCASPTAALRVGRLAEATERRFWEQTVDDVGRGLGLTPLLGMEWAERLGATVDWTACQVVVHEDRLLTEQEAACLAETYLLALHRISLRAVQETLRPDPVTPPVLAPPASLRVH